MTDAGLRLEQVADALRAALSAAVAHIHLRFEVATEGGVLTIRRTEVDPSGVVTDLFEEAMGEDGLTPLAHVSPAPDRPERLRSWAAAYARIVTGGPVGLLGTLTPLLDHAPLRSVDDFVAAMEDDALIGALAQAADPSWWDQETDAERARTAAESGNFVVLARLLDADPSLATTPDGGGFTLLHQVAERCDTFSPEGHLRCAELLARRGADPDAANADGNRPLHLARGRIVPKLVALGAQVDVRNRRGETPLVALAAEPDALDALRALLDAGADPGARDDGGQSALAIAESRGEDDKVALLHERLGEPG